MIHTNPDKTKIYINPERVEAVRTCKADTTYGINEYSYKINITMFSGEEKWVYFETPGNRNDMFERLTRLVEITKNKCRGTTK